jgi:tetratricopeptide (TPR) repeat protein
VRLDPGLAEAHFGLGLVLEARGMTAEAIAALREAVRLEPGWPVAAEALAWTLATSGDAQADDGREAVTLAEAARATAGADDPRTRSAPPTPQAEGSRTRSERPGARPLSRARVETRASRATSKDAWPSTRAAGPSVRACGKPLAEPLFRLDLAGG